MIFAVSNIGNSLDIAKSILSDGTEADRVATKISRLPKLGGG